MMSIKRGGIRMRIERNKLLLISLSNIQNFISNARKTKDLYKGSTIVKDMILELQTMFLELHEQFKIETEDRKYEYYFQILEEKEEKRETVPNFLLYKIKWIWKTKQEWKEDFEENQAIEKILYKKLDEKIEEKRSKIFFPYDIITYIVIENLEDSYKESYINIHRRLQAHKNSGILVKHLFSETQNSSNDLVKGQHICSLCGIRYGEEQEEIPDETKKESEDKSDKEYLCNECKKKRDYTKEKDKNSNAEEEKNFPSVDIFSRLGSIRETHYAIIRADIDNMGKKMSQADKEIGNNNCDLAGAQQKLKKFLLEFSKEIVDIVSKIDEENRLLIYAGGDDMLFFCPINKIIPTLEKMEVALKEQWKKEVSEKSRITMSKCVTIVHKNVPLKRVMQLSKMYLEETKNYCFKENKKTKNKIGFLLITSGYEQTFSIIDTEDFYLIKVILKSLQEKKFSRTFFYQLEKAILPFGEEFDVDERILEEIIRNEIKRILYRKSGCQEADRKQLAYEFGILFSAFQKPNEEGGVHQKLNYFFNLLHIIDKWNVEMKKEEEIYEEAAIENNSNG